MFEGNLASETARRCLYMVRTHCPKLMAVGDIVDAVKEHVQQKKKAERTKAQERLESARESYNRRYRQRMERETPEQREARLAKMKVYRLKKKEVARA